MRLRVAMLWQTGRALWRSGLFRISFRQIALTGRAWWRCRNSFAFLSEVAAIRFGPRLALWDDQGSLTFDELHRQSLALAVLLGRDFDVGPGRQVALACGNGRGFVLGLLACTRLGANVLPIAPELPARVLERILEREGISLMLNDAELEKMLPATFGDQPAPVKRGGELVVLTSGSSGVSKGIRRRPTLGQVLPLVSGLLEALPIALHRPTVLAIPLYHGYGLATLAMTLAFGAPLHTGRRYDIARLMERQRGGQEGPLLVTVPTLLSRWLKTRSGEDRPAAIVTGSAPLSADLCQELLATLGPKLFNLYGSTEAGLISLATPDILCDAAGSVGYPLPGNQVRLVDESDQDVSVGEVGRILVKGPFALPSRQDGWRDTGDLGRRDRRGHLFVCGRADAMIVSGGENVYPHELEEALASHPLVAETAILVVDDAEFGKRLAAAVTLRARALVEIEELREWLRQRLERHKLPRDLYIVEELPKNALGKIDKPALTSLLTKQG